MDSHLIDVLETNFLWIQIIIIMFYPWIDFLQ